MDLNRDGDGFLINTNDWSEEVMNQMADADGFVITDEIKTYIDKARDMFNQTGTVPAVRTFAKEFGMDRKATKLYEVFESGPMKKKLQSMVAYQNLLAASKFYSYLLINLTHLGEHHESYDFEMG